MVCYAMVHANWGEYYQPHAVRAVVQKDVRRVDTLAFQSRRTSISIDTWAIVREGMRRAVEHPGGTGGLARIKGIEVAGKTGTAQNPPRPDHAWFVGFAPYEDPRIAIAVLVENAGFGGSHAAPIAGMCMERYLYGYLIRNTPSPAAPHPAIAGRQTVAAPLASEER